MQYFLYSERIPLDLPIISSYEYEDKYYHLLNVVDDSKVCKKIHGKEDKFFAKLPTHFIVYRDHPSRKGLIEKRRQTQDIIFEQTYRKVYHIFTSDPIFIQKSGKYDRRESKIMLLEDIKVDFTPFKKRANTLVSRLKNILIFDRTNVFMKLVKCKEEKRVILKIEKISVKEGVSLTTNNPQHKIEAKQQYDFLYTDLKYFFLISNIEWSNIRPYDTYNGKSIQEYSKDLYVSRIYTFWVLKPILGKDVARLIAEMSYESQAII